MTPISRDRTDRSALEIMLVDFRVALAALEAEESERPRLSPDEVARAFRPGADKDQSRLWRAGRVATRVILERWAGAAIRCEPFVIEPGGRPRLKNAALHFSISHSGDAALIAAGHDGPIGVDIEDRRTVRMSAERQARLVAAAERLKGAPGDEATIDGDAYSARVMKAWVRLEAIAKASGAGIGRVLTDAGVVGPAQGRDASLVDGFEAAVLDVGKGRCGAVAAPRLPARIAVRDFPSDSPGLAEFLAERR